MAWGLSLFFISLLIPGYLALILLRHWNGWSWLDLFLAYGLGSFIVSGQIFAYLFIFRLRFNLLAFGLVLSAECLALLFFAARKITAGKKPVIAPPRPMTRKKRIIIFFLALFVSLSCLAVAINASSRPTVFYDSMAMWAFKAKVLFYSRQVDFNPGSSYFLGGGAHLDYPWGVPLTEFWLYALLGQTDDLVVNFIFAAYFISLLGIFFFFCRRYLGLTHSWLYTLFASSLPLVFLHGSNAYADLPLTLAIFVASGFWIFYRQNGQYRDLVISGIFWAIAIWTKDSAWLFVLPALAVTLLFARKEKKLKDFWRYGLLIFVLVFPWLAFKLAYFGRPVLAPGGIGWHPAVSQNFFSTLFRSGNWNLLWYLTVAVVIFAYRKIRSDQALLSGWLYVGLSAAVIFALFAFSGMYIYALEQTAISRVIMVLAPTCLWLSGLSLKKLEDSTAA